MNNKKLGNSFEKDFCDLLASRGWWVHFCSPSASGSQPCDVIAVKNGYPILVDCKTCVAKSFGIDRLEENQKNAFDRWERCGNVESYCGFDGDSRFLAVKHEDNIYMVPYGFLKKVGRVKLDNEFLLE